MDADVIVVGAGISGALVAARLAASGVKVLILEAGPRVQREHAVAQFFGAAVKVPECAYPNASYAPHPRSDDPDFYLVQTGRDRFKSTYLRQVGGTTWHWLGTCLRLVPDDFKLATRFGRGIDWPIDYATLEPWYGRAEDAIGVAGDSSEDLGSPRSTAYPMPSIAPSYLDTVVAKAFDGTGFDVRATPQGRNSAVRDDRPPCCGNSSCIPVCPIRAKYDATVHVARAERDGARVLSECIVHRIEIGREGNVTAIQFKRPDGSDHRAAAKVYVLAAHAIEIPKLLLMSRGPNAPNGVANSSDQVGRNLMDHPTQLSWALADSRVYPYRGPMSTSGIENPRAGDWRAMRPAFRIEIGNDGWSWPTGAPASDAQMLAAQGFRGIALQKALYERTVRQIRFASLTEQLPDAENRVTPDPVNRDALGLPRPRIAYRIDDYTKAGLAEARRIHEQAFKRLNATQIGHKTDSDFQGAGHVMGTARTGTDAKHAVVDRDLRAFDHPNLFIEGSAVFPTGGAANPTLTIAALALRSVDAIRAALTS
ncbi:MAG TPA: GMC family oxidoreductase [Casimicrobiaceae bacterium]|nr:GMC family oxidoreductase [Casimicrobiaceae bacterium]